MGTMGLLWVIYEEQRETTYMLLVKVSEDWRILEFIERCGHQLDLLLETTYLVRSYYVNCSEASKSCS